MSEGGFGENNSSFAGGTHGEQALSGFQAPKASILIVDDIASNLRVTEGLLSSYRMRISVCKSGEEAINMVSENRYDIMFLDHIMPGMDGTEVARKIREMDGSYFKSLPIIALTANTTQGACDLFIQNGMSDFLSKPIDADKLDSILLKWLPKDKLVSADNEAQIVPESDFVKKLRTIPELSVDKALRIVGGSSDVYERAVRMTARMLDENIKRVNEYIESDLGQYSSEIHGIKGVLNNIGVYSLGEVAAELEELSKANELSACQKLHPKFASGLKELLEKLTNIISGCNSESKPQGDVARLLKELPNILKSAEYYDSALALDLLGHVRVHTYGDEFDGILEKITHAFEVFEFDEAVELTEHLKGLVSGDGL